MDENGGIQKMVCFIMENPTKMDDLGAPLFQETLTYLENLCVCCSSMSFGLMFGGDHIQK